MAAVVVVTVKPVIVVLNVVVAGLAILNVLTVPGAMNAPAPYHGRLAVAQVATLLVLFKDLTIILLLCLIISAVVPREDSIIA